MKKKEIEICSFKNPRVLQFFKNSSNNFPKLNFRFQAKKKYGNKESGETSRLLVLAIENSTGEIGYLYDGVVGNGIKVEEISL